MITEARVLAALATVHDPELDEPITSLGFVGSCVVSDGGDVAVRLRLPTPQCAPNFAFLMASDAREAVRRVSGVGEDKMMFGSDYAIWEPKWQIEGLVDWDYPDDTFSDYPRWTTAAKKKALGLNAARLYDVDVPEELRLPADEGTPAAPDDAQLVEGAA